jgi:hypothetical protein
MMMNGEEGTPIERLRDAFSEIIRGAHVKREVHELVYEGSDLTSVFVDELAIHGYLPLLLEELQVSPGERIPAFVIQGRTAYFGWVFWEQFTSWKLRKLFGSVVRNARGDWRIQVPDGSRSIVYAHPGLKIEMDIDHPGEW